MSWYSNGRPDDFTKVNKGLNEPVNMLITFMVSIWKITGLNLMFSGSKGKPSSQANYGNTLVKLNVINKTIIFSIWLLQKLEVLRFAVSLSNELGRLSHRYKNLKKCLRP